MDRTQQTQPQDRELVYCHQCENEWYRDEHGIVCPECQSDFTEIIEADHDPRADEADDPSFHGFYAPDPDEADIRDFDDRSGGQGGLNNAGGLTGLLGSFLNGAVQSIVNGQGRQQMPQGQAGAHDGFPFGHERGGGQDPLGPPRQQQGGGNGTFVRHTSGPGFSFTITSTTSPNLRPRNANGPQPFNPQPDPLEQMMSQMIANIGVMHPHNPQGHGPGHFAGPPPIFMGLNGPGGGGQNMRAGGPFNINELLQLFAGGQHGDAVYSQEALDRVISQLMEQHATGNAPGPASTEAIESLPKKTISQKDIGDNGKADCSICMDEAELGSTVTELPCSHWFHGDCIKAWLTEHDTCPHCRQGIMPKDEPNTNRPRQPSQAPLHDMHSPEYQAGTAYPFPPAGGSGDGSRQNPFTVPESPTEPRRTGGSAGGMFSRMREAFSPSATRRDSNSGAGEGDSNSDRR